MVGQRLLVVLLMVAVGLATSPTASSAATGSISGTVTDAAGNPIAGAQVTFTGGTAPVHVVADSSGHYSAPGLETPTFYRHRVDGPVGSTFVPIDDFSGNFVADGANITSDFQLQLGGAIEGRVIDSFGNPVFESRVVAYGAESFDVETAGDGTYRLIVPPHPFYRVEFQHPQGVALIGKYWNDADYAGSTLLDVAAGSTTSGVDAELDWPQGTGAITGTVTTASGTPIAGSMIVRIHNVDQQVAFGYVRPDGTYVAGGIPPGEYVVEFDTNGSQPANLVTEFHPGAHTRSGAVPVQVSADAETIVDAELEVGGSISGLVGGLPPFFTDWASTTVYAFTIEGEEVQVSGTQTSTDPYVLRGLPPGDYYVRAEPCVPCGVMYQNWYYGDAPDLSSATLVHVEAGQAVTGIDIDPPPLTPTTGIRMLPFACPITPTGAIAQGDTAIVDVRNQCFVPSDATSVLVTIWAVDPIAEGNLRLGPAGQSSTLGVVNFGANGLENSTTTWVPVSTSGQLELGVNGGNLPTGTTLAAGTQVEVLAWSGTGLTPALGYHPTTPCAFYDTRANQGASDPGPHATGTTHTVDLTGTFPAGQGGGQTDCGVPITATAALVNFIAIQPTGAVRLDAPATDATLVFNQPMNQPFNNAAAVLVPLDTNGNLTIDIAGATDATTHVRAQVLGYLDTSDGLTLQPTPPCVAFDTRSNQGASGSFAGPRIGDNTTTYQITGTFPSDQGGGNTTCNIPAGAQAVQINLVAVNALQEGNLRAGATGTTLLGGVLNFGNLTPKMNNANAVIVPLSATGQLDVTTNGGPHNSGLPITELRGTITGYLTPD